MTEILFVAVVAAVMVMFVFAVLKMEGPRDRYGVVLLVLAFWLAVPGVLAYRGDLDRYAPVPPPGFILFALLTLGTVMLAFSGFGARMARLPLAGLVGFQVFRVPLELVLHRLYAEGVIPVQMTYAGRNFDIVTGVLAALLAVWIWKGQAPRWLVLAWNLLGLVLLANVVTIAVLSTPVPFRQFMNEPANLLPSTFPYVWLPMFLVQAALFGHLLVFRAIRRGASSR
ncbi:MAG: hypothetical protein JWQ76_717 [Ramlibacter sp.]|nr:hypothetical protein [Ramlibacter sp.]